MEVPGGRGVWRDRGGKGRGREGRGLFVKYARRFVLPTPYMLVLASVLWPVCPTCLPLCRPAWPSLLLAHLELPTQPCAGKGGCCLFWCRCCPTFSPHHSSSHDQPCAAQGGSCLFWRSLAHFLFGHMVTHVEARVAVASPSFPPQLCVRQLFTKLTMRRRWWLLPIVGPLPPHFRHVLHGSHVLTMWRPVGCCLFWHPSCPAFT
jgi:hypothetical protein